MGLNALAEIESENGCWCDYEARIDEVFDVDVRAGGRVD